MILLAGASISHSSTDVKVSAHDPQSGLPYSYSITTVDTVPAPANILPPTTGYNNPYPTPATPVSASVPVYSQLPDMNTMIS